MTKEEMLKRVRMLGQFSDTDDVLSAYIDIARDKILRKAYPYNDDVTVVPVKYEGLQCEIAVFLLNKRGAEGQTSHSENGIVRVYESADVPASMLRDIIPYCGVIG